MNRNEFINLIEDKVQPNRQMIGEVSELIDIFPYFQSAHLLLLKTLSSNSDVKFEKQLRFSAIHIADREVLYYYLKTKPASAEEMSMPDDEPKSAEETVRSEEALINDGEILPDHQQVVIETAKNSEQMISEIEQTSEEAQKKTNDGSLTGHSHSILIPSESDSQQPDEVMTMLDSDSPEDEERIFYMDPGFSAPAEVELLELEDEDPGKGSDKNLSQSDLIDRFIQANPRIEAVRSTSKTPPEDISKPYTENTGGFVTETLARIYITQGYYSRAIDIYEKLSLKFPEKSSYFASQIELIKEYIKK